MQEFLGEDDLQAFERRLRAQGIDPATTAPEALVGLRSRFDDAKQRRATSPKVGLMKLTPGPVIPQYAVAVREGSDLWLTLRVRRSRKGEVFVMFPRNDRSWNPHMSYHLDGTLHMKFKDRKLLECQKRQPLTCAFRGSEHVGVFYGHAPKYFGIICNPADFSGVVEVLPGVLESNRGGVAVDLVEPGYQPPGFPWTQTVTQQVFREMVPWLVMTVGSSG